MSQLQIGQIREARAAILQALYEVYPKPLGESLLNDAVARAQNTRISLESIHQGIAYLEGHSRITKTTREEVWIARITPAGIDFLESDERANRMHVAIRRMLRLRVLQALNALPTRPVHENMIRKYLDHDVDLDITASSIHRACHYLADVGFANWVVAPDDRVLRITSAGIDYLEGDGEDVLGVKRPIHL